MTSQLVTRTLVVSLTFKVATSLDFNTVDLALRTETFLNQSKDNILNSLDQLGEALQGLKTNVKGERRRLAGARKVWKFFANVDTRTLGGGDASEKVVSTGALRHLYEEAPGQALRDRPGHLDHNGPFCKLLLGVMQFFLDEDEEVVVQYARETRAVLFQHFERSGLSSLGHQFLELVQDTLRYVLNTPPAVTRGKLINQQSLLMKRRKLISEHSNEVLDYIDHKIEGQEEVAIDEVLTEMKSDTHRIQDIVKKVIYKVIMATVNKLDEEEKRVFVEQLSIMIKNSGYLRQSPHIKVTFKNWLADENGISDIDKNENVTLEIKLTDKIKNKDKELDPRSEYKINKPKIYEPKHKTKRKERKDFKMTPINVRRRMRGGVEELKLEDEASRALKQIRDRWRKVWTSIKKVVHEEAIM